MLLVVGSPIIWAEQVRPPLQAGFLAYPHICADASKVS